MFLCIKVRAKGSKIEVGHREIIHPPIASIHFYTSVCLDCRVELSSLFQHQSQFVSRLTRLRYQKSTPTLSRLQVILFSIFIFWGERSPLLRKGKRVDKPQLSYLLLQGYCGSKSISCGFTHSTLTPQQAGLLHSRCGASAKRNNNTTSMHQHKTLSVSFHLFACNVITYVIISS